VLDFLSLKTIKYSDWRTIGLVADCIFTPYFANAFDGFAVTKQFCIFELGKKYS
jgi:hypothetical protein